MQLTSQSRGPYGPIIEQAYGLAGNTPSKFVQTRGSHRFSHKDRLQSRESQRGRTAGNAQGERLVPGADDAGESVLSTLFLGADRS